MTRFERRAGIAGGIGLLIALTGWMFWPDRFYHAWLAALTAWLGWPIGSMALLLVHAQTGGRWGLAIRPALLAGVTTLPLLLPAVLPLLFGLPVLYPWLRPAAQLENAFYLNAPFFAGRGGIYLVAWFGLAGLILWSLRRGERALRRLAPGGLIVLAFTMTFAAIDSTMSLDPHFNSSIYGLIAMAGAVLLAMSVAIMISAATTDVASRGDLGKLLLGLVVLWAYLDFMQLLIVWEADLSREAAWYVRRSHGVWAAVIGVIAIGHLLLPFALLIVPRWRCSARVIAGVAGLLVAMEILRSWWLVLPAAGHGIGLLDIGAMLAIGGCAAALAARGRRSGMVAAVCQESAA